MDSSGLLDEFWPRPIYLKGISALFFLTGISLSNALNDTNTTLVNDISPKGEDKSLNSP